IELLASDDLVLTVQTVDGIIESSFPIEITNHANRENAVLTFGRARDTLIASGHESSVSIVDSD
ncbi:MAG: hypothetical protein D6800_06825, partial [Candidatus Zixiibacteriota bacterium]